MPIEPPNTTLTNTRLRDHRFLAGMYADRYFPDHLVDKGVRILIGVCERIESEEPADLAALYVITHAATEEFNDLDLEFGAEGSAIETVARDTIGVDFETIAHGYGFEDADIEELIATRDW